MQIKDFTLNMKPINLFHKLYRLEPIPHIVSMGRGLYLYVVLHAYTFR